MAARLQTRLLIAVGGLALAAIGLVALAVRHETRLEFLEFTAVQRREASSRLPDLAPRIARDLDGRCCEAGLAGLATGLPSGAALVVLDAAGALVAAGGAAAVEGTRVG